MIYSIFATSLPLLERTSPDVLYTSGQQPRTSAWLLNRLLPSCSIPGCSSYLLGLEVRHPSWRQWFEQIRPTHGVQDEGVEDDSLFLHISEEWCPLTQGVPATYHDIRHRENSSSSCWLYQPSRILWLGILTTCCLPNPTGNPSIFIC